MNVYEQLAARLYVSPDCAKRMLLEVSYGGGDPWTRHLVLDAARKITWTFETPEDVIDH